MGSIKDLIKSLDSMTVKMKKASQIAIDKEAKKLVQDFQKRSPVDSGSYKAGWITFSPRFKSSGIYASAGIKNEDPKAGILDQGADLNTAPWYFPRSKSKSGKLTEAGGKIWAGGLNPGHSLTIGGATGPVLLDNESRQLQIANSVANHVIRVI